MISTVATFQQHDVATVALNVRRLMARHVLTFHDVVQTTGLDERTLRGLVRGTNNPHARTLHKLAHGLGVEVDELFEPAGSPRQAFDQTTNPIVESVVHEHTEIFQSWSKAELEELASQFGTGGPLSEAGVLAAAEAINAKRRCCSRSVSFWKAANRNCSRTSFNCCISEFALPASTTSS